MNPTKFVTLLYLSDKAYFTTADNVNISDYYLARRMPLAEMFGKNTVDLAEELIEMTVSVDWRRQQRRPIMCGDIMCHGAEPWVYVKYDKVKDKEDVTMFRLKTWPDYAIKALPLNSVKEIICSR